ncbi:MAG: hypothetical protein ACREJN_21245 [Nitrospiraceae bacterium]
MGSRVLHIPVSETVYRDRIFHLVEFRADRKDLLAELITNITMLLDEGFVGSIQINMSGGVIANVKAHEITSIPVKKYY